MSEDIRKHPSQHRGSTTDSSLFMQVYNDPDTNRSHETTTIIEKEYVYYSTGMVLTMRVGATQRFHHNINMDRQSRFRQGLTS